MNLLVHPDGYVHLLTDERNAMLEELEPAR